MQTSKELGKTSWLPTISLIVFCVFGVFFIQYFANGLQQKRLAKISATWSQVKFRSSRSSLQIAKLRLATVGLLGGNSSHSIKQLQTSIDELASDLAYLKNSDLGPEASDGLELYIKLSGLQAQSLRLLNSIMTATKQGNSQEAWKLKSDFELALSEYERSLQRLSGIYESAEYAQTLQSEKEGKKAQASVFFAVAALLTIAGLIFRKMHAIIPNPENSHVGEGGLSENMLDVFSLEMSTADASYRFPENENPTIARFFYQLNAILENVQLPLQNVSNTAHALKSTSDKLSKATEQVSLSVAGINKNLMTETINMDECLSLLNTIDFLLQTSSDSTKQAASLSRIAMDRAVQGGKSVYTTVDAMEKIAESAAKVEELINSIQDIAAQTNLLAINTAIEAAKAGEHGKGFAVIAEEVRKLAEHTKKLILEVNGLVVEQRNRVEAGKDLARNAGRSLDGIIKDVEAVSSLIQRVATAASKQVENSSVLVSNMHKTSEVVRLNSTEANDIAKNSEMVNIQVQKLNTLVADMTEVFAAQGFQASIVESTQTRIPIIPTLPHSSGIQSIPVDEATKELMRSLSEGSEATAESAAPIEGSAAIESSTEANNSATEENQTATSLPPLPNATGEREAA